MFRKNKLLWLWFFGSLVWFILVAADAKEEIAYCYGHLFCHGKIVNGYNYDPLKINTPQAIDESKVVWDKPDSNSAKGNDIVPDADLPDNVKQTKKIISSAELFADEYHALKQRIHWQHGDEPLVWSVGSIQLDSNKHVLKHVYWWNIIASMIIPAVIALVILCFLKIGYDKLIIQIGKFGVKEYQLIALSVRAYHRIIMFLLAAIIAFVQLYQISEYGLRGSGWILAVVSFGVLLILSLNGISRKNTNDIEPSVTLSPEEKKKRTVESVNFGLKLGGALFVSLVLIWFIVGISFFKA